MRSDAHHNQSGNGPRLPSVWSHRRIVRLSGLAVFGTVALLASAAQAGQEPATAGPEKPYIIPSANPLPDANARMQMNEQKAKDQNFDAANAERKRQLNDDSTKLLTLAISLKAEVDKTNKDTLSLNVIRKADEIEKLAHDVKEKMKLTVGGG